VKGKRQRYSNPFRFYLTVSIVFFLLVGLFNTKEKYKTLTQESKANIIDVIQEEASKVKKEINEKNIAEKDIDSIKKVLNEKMKKSFIPIP
jgi:hypothetical protein